MALSPSYFKRSLAFAFTLTATSLVAVTGNATNLVNYSINDWSGKDTSIGSFGAGYGADFTVDVVNGALMGEASGNAAIEIFDKKLTIIDLSATASINDASSDAGNLYAEVVGQVVYDESFTDGYTWQISVNEPVAHAEEFCKTFFDASTTFTIVVVPVTVSAGAEGCADLKFSATPQVTSHTGTLNLQVTPSLDVTLEASVGVGSKSFSAGITANVTLLNLELPITLAPSYNFTTNAFSYASTGQADLEMLSGSVDLYAKVKFLWWKKKYTFELFDWDGISKSWYLWNTTKPSATSSKISFNAQKASGSYTYSDTGNTAEGSSTYTWYRNSTPSDTGRTQIQSGTGSSNKSRTLTANEQNQYLQFCVTPKNSAGALGDQQCSDWESVGKMVLLYVDGSYGTSNGAALAIPYENLASGTCINLTSYSYSSSLFMTSTYNDRISSYKLYAPTNSGASFSLYKDTNCANTLSTQFQRRIVPAGGSNLQTSMADLGSGWDNYISSVMINYTETVAASDANVSISGNTATAGYTFEVSDGAVSETESGSSYKWYRATSDAGAGSALISGSTSVTHTLSYLDDLKYLKVCVNPSNGYTTGAETCSGWRAVGRLMKIWDGTSYTGDNLAIAWEKSPRETCFNLSDYNFNDRFSSWGWYNNNVANSTASFYKDANCGGEVINRTVAQGSFESYLQAGGALGSGWDNSISSFKMNWTSSVNITTPTLTILDTTATENHTYSGGEGLPEDATYKWYRASDINGTGAVEIENFNSSTYSLVHDDDRRFLKVCVLSSNGVVVDEAELCSGWTNVGPLVTFYSEADQGGTSLSFAYALSPSGTCFNLTNFNFNDVTSSFLATGPFGGGTLNAYEHVGCNDSGVQSLFLPPGFTSAHTYTGGNDTRSSFKVNY